MMICVWFIGRILRSCNLSGPLPDYLGQRTGLKTLSVYIFFSSFPFSDKVQVLCVKFFFNSQRLLCSLHLTQLKILYQVNGELSVNIHEWRIYLQKMNVSSVQRIETLMTKDPAKNSFFWGELNLSKPYIKLFRSTTSWEPCFPLHHLPLYLFTKAFLFSFLSHCLPLLF